MERTLTRSAVWGTCLILVAGAGQVRAGSHSKDLDNKDPNSAVDIIVQFTAPPTSLHDQKVLNLGGTKKNKNLNIIKAGAYSLPPGQVKKLEKDSSVVYISLDRSNQGALNKAASAVGANIAASYGYNGAGIGVAVLDSGISAVPGLNDPVTGQSHVVYCADFVQNTGVPCTGTDGVDQYGHGTHVAGIIGANTSKIQGIAPQASLLNFRVLDQNGSGSDSNIIAAINSAISLKSQYNIRVISLSSGRQIQESYTLDPLCQAVEAAWKAGIVVVVAAGNQGRNNSANTQGYGTIGAPGNDPYVLTVGAMKSDLGNGNGAFGGGGVATYSSKGPTQIDFIAKPDIVAPGNLVVSLNTTGPSTLAQESPSSANGAYLTLSGTSMATPIVSGAVALLLQKTPSLTPDQVKATLMLTASKNFPTSTTAFDATVGQSFTDYYDLFTIGAGYLNIPAALNNTSLSTGAALSPACTSNQSTGAVSLNMPGNAVWGNSVV